MDASLLDCLQALPVYLTDVQQSILTRQNLNEASVRHDGTHGTLIDLAHLGDGYDGLDLSQCGIDGVLVRS